MTKKLVDGLAQASAAHDIPVQLAHVGSMFGLFFTARPVANYDDAKTSDLERFGRWHGGMLERGVYLAPSQFEAGFLSTAHDESTIDCTLAAAAQVFENL
jgi:glutamate-1-semialdehyde 2,1-aminomutase